MALLGTITAVNVPLLDPSINSLQPVLRSNFWLTIHVLTEVSSYAAFGLAWALGLIAMGYYLTATYRRSPRFAELALPLVPGLPLLAVGARVWPRRTASFGDQLDDRRHCSSTCSRSWRAGGGMVSLGRSWRSAARPSTACCQPRLFQRGGDELASRSMPRSRCAAGRLGRDGGADGPRRARPAAAWPL